MMVPKLAVHKRTGTGPSNGFKDAAKRRPLGMRGLSGACLCDFKVLTSNLPALADSGTVADEEPSSLLGRQDLEVLVARVPDAL